jgi:hypothetical protein
MRAIYDMFFVEFKLCLLYILRYRIVIGGLLQDNRKNDRPSKDERYLSHAVVKFVNLSKCTTEG